MTETLSPNQIRKGVRYDGSAAYEAVVGDVVVAEIYRQTEGSPVLSGRIMVGRTAPNRWILSGKGDLFARWTGCSFRTKAAAEESLAKELAR